MKITPLLLIACLLLLPVYASGEDQGFLVSSVSSESLIGDNQSLYMLDSKGSLLQYLPEEKEIATNFDAEQSYPFMMDGEIYVFNRQNEFIAPLNPKGDKSVVYIPITRELADGDEYWSLRSLKADKNVLYFLYTDEARETPLLCRYHFEEKVFDTAEIEWLSEYFLTESGEIRAIIRDTKNTTVCAVDFDGEAPALYSLEGYWAGFAPDGEELLATDITEHSFVRLQGGKELARVRSPYAAGVWEGLAVNGQYYVLGEAGLYKADFNAGQSDEPEQTLRVLNGYADETDRAFMIAHPNVKLEYMPFQESDGLEFGQALITGILNYDVASVSNVTPAVESLMDKGYMMDLSQSPLLLQKAQGMYKPVRDLIFRNEQLLIMPYYFWLQSYPAEPNADNMKAAGISEDDLPQTMGEYLDFIIDWRAERGEPESSDDIVPVMDDVGDTKMIYLMRVMQAYAAHYRRAGQALDFDTQEFRTLIGKAMMAAEATIVVTETVNYKSIFYYAGDKVPRVNSLVFPLSRNESPRYEGQISGYIVDPRSPQKELAMEYIAWRISHMNPVDNILLSEGQYEAIERADFPATLERWKEQKKLVEEAIAREDNEAEKRVLQESLDRWTQNIEHPDDGQRYEITDDQIAFYQQEIVPNLELPFTDITTEFSQDNADTWQLMKRFVDGELDDERFISALNQRERLRRLENK